MNEIWAAQMKNCAAKYKTQQLVNILVFYHLILVAVEVVVTTVCTTDEIWKHEFNYDVDLTNRSIDIIFKLWVTAIINYVCYVLLDPLCLGTLVGWQRTTFSIQVSVSPVD